MKPKKSQAPWKVGHDRHMILLKKYAILREAAQDFWMLAHPYLGSNPSEVAILENLRKALKKS